MADVAERHYGMITITVVAEPMIGKPPAWANVIEIAEEAILIAKRRNQEASDSEEVDHKGRFGGLK